MTGLQPTDIVSEAQRVLKDASRIHALHDADPKRDEDVSWLVEALAKENTALREQLTEAQQLAETRSDIIAAKAAHIDQLQSRLTGRSTSSLLRRLKDFLFENCNHSERDRNYDWCPSCVMAFMDVVAQPSDTELKERLAQVEKELATTKQHRDDLIEELKRQP